MSKVCNGNAVGVERHDYPFLEEDITGKAQVIPHIVVVGGGVAGLTAALFTQLANPFKRVVLLEANQVAGATSGMNGGQISTGIEGYEAAFRNHIEQLCRADGMTDQTEIEKSVYQGFKDFYEMLMLGHGDMRQLIKNAEIQCEYKEGIIYGALSEDDFNKKKASTETLQNYFKQRVEYLETSEEVSSYTGSERYVKAIHYLDRFSINPAKYMMALAALAQEAGVDIYENTKVQSIEQGQDKSVLKCVNKLGKTVEVEAMQTVVAVHAGVEILFPEIAKQTVRMPSFIGITEQLPEDLRDAVMPKIGAMYDSDHFMMYMRMTEDHRIIYGRGETHSLAEENLSSASRVDDIAGFIQDRLHETFPVLREQGIKIESIWGGDIAYTSDCWPVVRENEYKNLTVLAGSGGTGMCLMTSLAMQLANKLNGESYNPALDLLASMPHKTLHDLTRETEVAFMRKDEWPTIDDLLWPDHSVAPAPRSKGPDLS